MASRLPRQPLTVAGYEAFETAIDASIGVCNQRFDLQLPALPSGVRRHHVLREIREYERIYGWES